MEAQLKRGSHPWFPISSRLANASISYARYLGKAVWPSNLALFYPHSDLGLAAWQTLLSLAVMLLITGLVAVLWRRRYLTVGWLWFVGTLVPMIGLIQAGAQGMADRYAYLPFVGLFIMICWGAPDLYARLAPDHRRSTAWQGAICLAVLFAMAVLTRRQISFWSDEWILWSHALQVTKRNVAAEQNLAGQLIAAGRIEEGIAHLYHALEFEPNDPTANLDVGAYEVQHGNPAQAIGRFQRVVARQDVPAEFKANAFNDMGQAYRDLGDYQRAGQSFAAAVTQNPGHVGAWINLGATAQKVGKLDLAIKAYSRAMEIQPEDWGYLLLAGALQQGGRRDEARAATEHAKSISFDLNAARRSAEQELAR
jgi:Flp pilus assembly protein TadD